VDLPGETLEQGKPEGHAKRKMPDELEHIECQKRKGTEVGMIVCRCEVSYSPLSHGSWKAKQLPDWSSNHKPSFSSMRVAAPLVRTDTRHIEVLTDLLAVNTLNNFRVFAQLHDSGAGPTAEADHANSLTRSQFL